MARDTNYGESYLDPLVSSVHEVMEAYDSLPPIVRHAYAYSVNNFAPQPAVELLGKGVDPVTLASIIIRADKKEVAKHKKDQL